MKFSIAALALVLLAGCATSSKTPMPTPVLTPPVAEAPAPQDNPGSLFTPSDANYLYGDTRARNVGDVVIVEIVEVAKATNKADTTADRASSVEMGVTNWFGKNDARLLPFGPSLGLVGKVGDTPMIGASSSSKFEGTGETKRESNVSATLAARVVRVMPGGLMEVEGAREVKVNNETQVIVVRGLVRSQDISPSNTIASTHMADAKIEYYGQGVLADKQRPGWMTRLLDNIWPF